MFILLLKNNEYHKKYQKKPKKIPKIEKKKENEYHESYVNVCKYYANITNYALSPMTFTREGPIKQLRYCKKASKKE